MDEPRAVDYYLRRLLVSVFGQWVGLVSEAREAEDAAVSLHSEHTHVRWLTRLRQHCQRTLHADYQHRLASTMYCLLLLHRGVQRWRRHHDSSTGEENRLKRADRCLRRKRLRQGWNRLRRKAKVHHHFTAMRSSILANVHDHTDSLHGVDVLLKSARRRLLANANHHHDTTTVHTSNAANTTATGSAVITAKAKQHRIQQCQQVFQKLSFWQLFQSQGRQHQVLVHKLWRKRQKRRVLRRFADYQDRHEQLVILYRLCGEHYVHCTFRRFVASSKQHAELRLQRIAGQQVAIRHHHDAQRQRVLFYFKEYAIQQSFARNRLVRCADHIALPNAKLRALRRWRHFADRRRHKRQSCLAIPIGKASKVSALMLDKVMLYVVKVWRFRRLHDYVAIWRRHRLDFRKRHQDTMQLAMDFNRSKRLTQSMWCWRHEVQSVAAAAKRLLRKARFHHAQYHTDTTFSQFAERLRETRKQFIQGKYVAVSFYKLYRYQQAVKQWRRFAKEKQSARQAVYQAKQDHHRYQQRQCAKLLLVVAIEKNGEDFTSRVTMRHFYRQWKYFLSEQKKLQIDATVQKIKHFQKQQETMQATSQVTFKLSHSTATNYASINSTAMLARTPPRYSSALNAASPLLLSPTSITDFYSHSTASISDANKYYAARAPPRGLTMLPVALDQSMTTRRSAPSPHSPVHSSPTYAKETSDEELPPVNGISKRDKLLLFREVLQFIQEQRSMLSEEEDVL